MNVKQAANVLELLEFFAAHQRPASLAEIAKHFDWPRSSTFNLLGTLAQRGYLYEPRPKAGYYPTPAWATLIGKIEQSQPMPKDMRALLEQLVADTGETAVLAAVSGSDALFVETVESPHSVRYAAPVGKRVPLHTTATGRTLLSQMRADERAGVLRKVAFEQYTPTTLMSAEEVEAEIALSVRRGWFQGNAEFTPELGGVCMALALGERRFALLVAGPMYRVSHRLPELAGHIRQRIDAYLAAHVHESGS
ncbi:IclR family transcriptional regulator [Diaphorobacter caeni]|uniref:IclR family transcriptional regulator n=1 Tax=Diaphorobacter caeni TaxID=2784387 RepID=UPI00188EFAB1|nr:IclR family transcriptional regulator [Diaphorobacter caeni]MBF5005212.1 IclR family transcriptional regulator [Diaphorobacter caeni]